MVSLSVLISCRKSMWLNKQYLFLLQINVVKLSVLISCRKSMRLNFSCKTEGFGTGLEPGRLDRVTTLCGLEQIKFCQTTPQYGQRINQPRETRTVCILDGTSGLVIFYVTLKTSSYVRLLCNTITHKVSFLVIFYFILLRQ